MSRVGRKLLDYERLNITHLSSLPSRHINIPLDNPMSSTRNASETSSSNFEAPSNNEALTKYTQKTGTNLRYHLLASKIDSCESAESFSKNKHSCLRNSGTAIPN